MENQFSVILTRLKVSKRLIGLSKKIIKRYVNISYTQCRHFLHKTIWNVMPKTISLGMKIAYILNVSN